jgi:mono/diheme cytochrome c family protein
MVDQPSISPQEKPMNPPVNTVPTTGIELSLSRQKASEMLKNPVAFTPESIKRGREKFQTYCSPCHGPDAKGKGPVSKKFIPPPDLTSDFIKSRSDGYLYSTIRNGGAIMPAYGKSISAQERWDIVNFIRSLQGK